MIRCFTPAGRRRLTALPWLWLVAGLAVLPGRADEPKNRDKDVHYDEAQVPPYDLPPLLLTAEGRRITTPEEWFNIRRPQIMGLFGNLIYGTVPEPASPLRRAFTVDQTDRHFLQDTATRKVVRVGFANDRGQAEMQLVVITPNGRDTPAPILMLNTFDTTHGDAFDAAPDRPGRLRNGIPLGDILRRGWGFAAVYQQDLVGHNEVTFSKGIHPLFYRPGQSFPKAHECGVIAAVAWGFSRALDYLATDSDCDARRVALMGHSKMGKATLWAAAQDQRFALAIAAQSGCGGAALWRRKTGETLAKMATRFPYWLCRNAGKYVNNEDDLPVDQHMLLACIAPRPVYLAGGQEDRWADPLGQYETAWQAGEVYRLLGKSALTDRRPPPLDQAIIDSAVGFHNRPGGHSVQDDDWNHFLDFATHHLGR